MITNVKRIRNWQKYSKHIPNGEQVFIGLEITDELMDDLQKIGFEDNLIPGRAICPSPELGRVSKFNAEGRLVKQRNLPKETAYRQVHWEWQTWDGQWHSGWRDVPYQRYPRKLIDPPSEYLTIIERGGKKFIVVSGSFVQGEIDGGVPTHKVNLMLELFGKADVLRQDMQAFIVPKLIKVNWRIIPEGELPWSQSKERLASYFQRVSASKLPLVKQRLETISKYQPEFIAQGVDGYRGYLVFGFTRHNLFVLESPEYGNATYVFEGDWKQVSQLTKAEILAGNLHKHRVVHMTSWEKEIEQILKPALIMNLV
ncbi:hypothetical protein I532_13354 [Brevibacillus borstelensis AK1]|uniref:Uncharacterized protein n=1 Tax=Brevibacillus borstelensis AK1 TaxID=1300222 RepID=M8E034_9BACL|nr:hypothetical protein [Brevibacillus borstelensis]EMT52646.1 hypothetical protein I532_13354 [Brevibacillus borstelensis AK1]